MTSFDVCVIGSGLIGSSAAKYLIRKNLRVCLVGPFESIVECPAENREAFGAWNDISRATHTLFTDVVWAHLANESIRRYRSIEKESGVDFFTETSYLVVSNSPAYIKRNVDVGRQVDAADSLQLFDDKLQLENRFPFLRLNSDVRGVFEPNNCGIINPVRLVRAQRILFEKGGGIFLDGTVVRISQELSDSTFSLFTQNGTVVQCKKVVVCAGAFLGHHQLLPVDCRLDVSYRPTVACRIRIDCDRLLKSLENMPPFIFVNARDETVSEAFAPSREPDSDGPTFGSSIYCFQPILYPDGNYYLKIGYLDDSSEFENRLLTKSEDITEILRSSTRNEQKRLVGQQLMAIAKRIFKGFDCDNFEIETCCFVRTPSGKPYIGSVAQDWHVVTGDNGLAAKSSDEIGRLAAEFVVNDKWTCSFPAEDDVRVRALP